MKKSELKELIKPIVAECVKESVMEIMLESGLLASVISEVVKGIGPKTVIKEVAKPAPFVIEDDEDEDLMAMRRQAQANIRIKPVEKQKIQETKKQLVEAVGRSGYAGLGNLGNVFEGIKETIPDEVEGTPGNPLSGIAPNDPGVKIDGLLEIAGGRWAANLKGKTKDK